VVTTSSLRCYGVLIKDTGGSTRDLRSRGNKGLSEPAYIESCGRALRATSYLLLRLRTSQRSCEATGCNPASLGD
jgi:hypothetical protein